MSRPERRTRGNASPRRVLVSALAVTIVTAGVAAGAGGSPGFASNQRACPARAIGGPIALGRYVAPMAAATLDQGDAYLGWPYYEFEQQADSFTVRDSSAVGIITSRAGETIAIPQPVPGMLMDNPRLRRVSGSAVDVIFSAAVGRPEVRMRSDSFALWGGRLERGVWRGVTQIARLPKRSVDHPQIAGDGVTFRDELVAGVLALEGEFSGARLALVRGAGSRWRVEYPLPGLLSASYLDLAVVHDTLWLATVASLLDPLSDTVQSGVWLSHATAGGWAAPRLMHVSTSGTAREPRLLGSRDGLVLAWVERVATRTMVRWRGVAATGSSSVHERPMPTFLVRGIEDFTNLVGAADDDTTAVILELTPDTGVVLATVPTVMGIPALVMGRASRPVAVAPASAGLAGKYPVWLETFDLRCILPTGNARR